MWVEGLKRRRSTDGESYGSTVEGCAVRVFEGVWKIPPVDFRGVDAVWVCVCVWSGPLGEECLRFLCPSCDSVCCDECECECAFSFLLAADSSAFSREYSLYFAAVV
jgi:hypothetical protein